MDIKTFNNIEKLYHYTSFEAATQILANNNLLFGKLNRQNDINEAYRSIFWQEGIDSKEIEKELSKHKQLSLTIDKSPRSGFGIPAMWGHYAQKGTGVCIVFDKQKLLSSLSSEMHAKSINYDENYDSSIIVNDSNIEDFFTKHLDELFFLKTNDWAYEQELRIITKNTEDITYLDLKDGCIMAVIMFYSEPSKYNECVLTSPKAKVLKKIVPNIPLLEAGYWDGEINLKDEQGNQWFPIDCSIIESI